MLLQNKSLSYAILQKKLEDDFLNLELQLQVIKINKRED